MLCKYIEKCKKCRGSIRWLCAASIPKKRVMDRKFCFNPVESECAVYKRAIVSDKK